MIELLDAATRGVSLVDLKQSWSISKKCVFQVHADAELRNILDELQWHVLTIVRAWVVGLSETYAQPVPACNAKQLSDHAGTVMATTCMTVFL